VVLVEQGDIGGDCTFTGCIPSKAVIEAAVRGEGFDAAMARARDAVATVAGAESAPVLRSEGITVVEGRARFVDRRTVDVDGRRIRGGAVVVAAGAGPAVPRVPGLDTVPYLTNETLFDLDQLPGTLAILGGGPVGVEMADAFSRLGARVAIIEAAHQLLPQEEPLAARVLAQALSELGAVVRTGSAVTRVEPVTPSAVRLVLADGSSVEAEALLVAAGRRPATGGLGLEATGVEVDDAGFVIVDARLRTTARGVFAAGDAAHRLQFTHVADETGRIAAFNALSRVPLRRFRPGSVPRVTFTNPEVASVGLTEAEAAHHGGRVAYLPMTEVDRAIAAGATGGFVMVLAGPRRVTRNLAGGRFLGATIVAPRAGEMLHELVLAMAAGMFPARLALTTHAYPTWSVAVRQAVAQFFGVIGGRSSRPAATGPVADPVDHAGAA
jgi:pyruvate/2-oxoglutarate dehydrogenase complex dihydrolipoamide dehydrogenase (E3) component